MSINIFDTKHEITDFGNGIELHRFKNGAGEPYSAIYINSAEIYSCNRENESKMLDWFKLENCRTTGIKSRSGSITVKSIRQIS